jgi:hypothetical protein
MNQMTERKINGLKARGFKKVGEILQDETGEFAYVEGGAVRWLGSEGRDIFMLCSNEELGKLGESK